MRRAALAAAAVAAAVLAAACAVRIAQVNAAYPEQRAYEYHLGEEATYAGQDSSGDAVASGSITVQATGFKAVGYAGLRQMVPGYADSLIDDGTATDMRALFIDVRIRNASDAALQVHVRDFKLEDGAWSNGLYAPLYMSLNEGPSTIVGLGPGEEAERTLVYLRYGMGGSDSADWATGEYRLVLALYPDKYAIALGTPDEG